jgi:hypothetical protein
MIHLAGIALAWSVINAPAESFVRPVKPLVVWTGTDGHIKRCEFLRVTTSEQWDKLWLEHIGKTELRASEEGPARPEIDFKRCMVIAIFPGDDDWGYGIVVASATDEKDCVRVRYRHIIKQIGIVSNPPMNEASLSRPFRGEPGSRKGAKKPPPAPPDPTTYAIMVVPASAKPIVFEVDVSQVIDGRAEWKQRFTLEALDPR